MFSKPRHTSSLLTLITIAGGLFLLLTFLTASSLFSAPNSKIVQVLNLNDRLTVKGQKCQPHIQSQADAKIVIRCVKSQAQNAPSNAAGTKLTITLNPNDKLTIKRKACRLQLTAMTNARLKIVCDSGPLPPIVPDTTKPLSSDTTQYLTSVSQDGATFTFSQATAQLNGLQIGDAIVGNPTQAAPGGFLRKVVSVTNDGGQIIVDTQPTTLADAVQQGEITISQVLQPTNLKRASFAKGVQMVQRPDAPNSFSLQLNNVVLYDKDGNENTTNDQVNANGSIDLNPNFDFRLKVENFQLRGLFFTMTGAEISQLKIASKVFVTARAEKVLASYPLGPIFFAIGPVPVTVYPVITITAGLDGTISASVSTGVTETTTETAGVSYENNTWTPIKQFNDQFQFDPPTLSTGFSIKAYTGAKLKLLFYGSIGPDIALNGYLKLDANPLETPWWKLYGGLEVPVGISIDIFSHVIAGWSAVVIDDRILLDQSHTPPPTATSTPIATSTPTPTPTVRSTAVAITAGTEHTCALTTGGGLKCWGSNISGELGVGTNNNSNVPVNVSGLGSGVSAITAGAEHTCALTTAGGLKCWGDNDQGGLGDGTYTDSNVPVNVSGLGSGVSAITAGWLHTCALTTGGPKCWGFNGDGELGDGTNTSVNVPVNVSGLGSGVSAITAGGYHTCALTTGGGLKCWGYNTEGGLGDGTNTASNVPVNVSGLESGVSAVTAGWYYTCALTTGGGVKCWGYNDQGGLGDGTYMDSNVPVNVSGLGSGVSAITASAQHTCALTTGGGVKCWGDNEWGQLGDGTNTDSNVPVDVSGLGSGVSAITAGWYHTCALTTEGGIKCWGFNRSGQLGDGTYIDSNVPVDIVGFGP